MLRETGKRMTFCGVIAVTAAFSLIAWSPAAAADTPPKPFKSGIVSFDDAPAHQADWGEMRRYFTGETAGTKDVLTAVAIVKPGKAVHRAHRHAQEEYLILVEGSGTWSLDGKEFPAKRGDILYTEPWDSAALKAGDHGKDVETIEYRKRFYPGDKYVDISGIDIYTNVWYGWGDFREDSFPKAFQIMGQVTPGKMLALCECQGLPNPEIMAKDGPHWLYCLPWYVGKDPKWNPPDWVKKVYGHEVFVTLDQLPKWSRRDQGSAVTQP